jgi:hypothetical protein
MTDFSGRSAIIITGGGVIVNVSSTDARATIRSEVLHDSGFPQLIVRIGWAATSSDPVPDTPRRPLDEVVRPL